MDTWGERHAFKYQKYIDDALDKIAENPVRIESKNANEYFSDARSLKVQKHIIFYVVKNEQIVILRVLHQSMKIDKHFDF